MGAELKACMYGIGPFTEEETLTLADQTHSASGFGAGEVFLALIKI